MPADGDAADPLDPDRLRAALAPFRAARTRTALLELVFTFLPFLALEVALYRAIDVSYWLVLALAVPAAGFVVRIFIIQHDCGHGSFLPSRRANDLVGRLCSLVTLTPYAHWRRQHANHHAVWNNLDRRESGLDFYSSCLTLAEYQALTPAQQRRYRVIRHPVPSLLLLPPLIFLVLYRLPFDTPSDWRRERRSVHLTNLALVGVYGTLGLALGFGSVAAVQLPVIAIAAIIGVWLFSLQHRFEGVRWLRAARWTRPRAAIAGSSHLALPGPLDWLTGHIGFHHVHHLDTRIPCYALRDAQQALARRTALPPPLGLLPALGASRFALWDEAKDRMVRFPK
jgi:acyl-lipid omega-6 desaturase (Delta-12 desaturase)